MARDTKKSIKDFIDYVTTLEKEEDPEGNGFNKEYRLIHEFQVRKRRENAFKMDTGKLYNNLKKNRYKDILPYDEHRVILTEVEGEEESDYINASKLMGVRGTGGYIASQGPLAATVTDYWRMAWEYKVEIIFMACRIVEQGKIKCKQYWNDQDKSDEFGDITVFTESEEEISTDFIKRLFVVSRGDEQRRVVQFHYSGWPDHGIPRDPAHIRDLIGIMRQARQNDSAPLLVHCSAGCGRTGAIIAIDFVWTLLEEGRFDETFSLYELICNFREQRMSIVQTAEQYALVNQVLRSLCEEWVAKMASHTYENVEIEGQDYANVGSKENGEEEEHIYMDGGSLQAEREAGATTTSRSPSQPLVVDPEAPAESAPPPPPTPPGPGPEIIEVNRPKAKVTTSNAGTYENVKLLSEPKMRAPAPPPPGSEAEGAVQHRTVIQIGSPSGTPKQQASGAAGGANVIYLVGPERKSVSAVPPLSPKTNKRSGSLQGLEPNPQSQRANSTSGADSLTVVGVAIQPQHAPSAPAPPQSEEGVASSAIYSFASAPSEAPKSSVGFGERLPRVTGPVPLPASWDNK